MGEGVAVSNNSSKVIRQWVSMPGGSCDLRVGDGAIGTLGTVLKGSTGKPHTCALVTDGDVSDELAERVRRLLTDAGYLVRLVRLAGEACACTLPAVEGLATKLAELHVTADDVVCAVGGVDVLSLSSFVCASWCTGTPLAHIPTDLYAAITASTTPRGIGVAGVPDMLSARAGAKYQLCDLGIMETDPSSAAFLNARATMVASALCDSEQAVSRLWDRAELRVGGDLETLKDQLADTAKSRGHIVASTSIATRQTIDYGRTFMRALSRLTGGTIPEGLLLAEAIRFQSRIAAAMEILSVDDVLTMDELLDLLGLEPVTCDVDPDELVAALREERFLRSSRFIICLPRGIGRVRPASVDEDLLAEHAGAWCATRASA